MEGSLLPDGRPVSSRSATGAGAAPVSFRVDAVCRSTGPCRASPGPARLPRPAPILPAHSRVLTFSAVGKSLGSSVSVTLPVATHSVPRASVTRKPTHFIAASLWPNVVWNTRPLP